MLSSVVRCARLAGPGSALRNGLVHSQRPSVLSVTRRCLSNTGPTPGRIAFRINWSLIWSQQRKLFSVVRPEYKRLALACALLLVSTSVTMAVPASIGKVLDMIFGSAEENCPNEFRQKLTNVALVLAGLFVVGAAAKAGGIFLVQTSAVRVARRLREQVYSNVMRQEMAFFDTSHSGDHMSHSSQHANVVGGAVTWNVANGLCSLLHGVGGLGMMFYLSPELAKASLIVVPPIACLYGPYFAYTLDLGRKIQADAAQSVQVADEKIGNMRTVRYFGQEQNEMERYDTEQKNMLKLQDRDGAVGALFFGSARLVVNLAGLAVLWKGGVMMQTDAITVGQFTAFLLYLAYAGKSVNGLRNVSSKLLLGLAAGRRIWELTERQSAIPITGGLKPDASLLTKTIRFQDIFFTYPTRPDLPVFTGLNLTLDPGKVTAVVGVSGSGKSSLASLLLRLYECDKGRIVIGDTNIKELDPQWLRTRVGIVGQEPVLFSGTLAKNIGYGRPRVLKLPLEQRHKQLIEVASKANALEFIETFPKQLDTEIGENGVQLSAGQKQRIAIARALLKNPQVLILDEAKSALDARSEKLVQQAMEQLMFQRTVLTMAHRLPTLRTADRIVVLQHGVVAEQGTYNDLMSRKSGHFRQLVQAQTFRA